MYVKRKLGVGDLMPVVRIAGKIGVSDFKKCFSGENIKKTIKDKVNQKENSESDTEGNDAGEDTDVIEQIGFEAFMEAADVLLMNIPKCENELYGFLSSMCDVSVEDFKKLPPSAFIDILQEIFTAEESKDFFSHAAKLLNLN